MAGGRFGRLR